MINLLLRIFSLECDYKTCTISPHVRYISPDNVLQDLYRILNCDLVTTFAKLLEHSWWDNSFVNAFSELLYNEPSRVAWVGDYADEPDDFDFSNCSAVHFPCYDDIWCETIKPVGISFSNFTLDNKFLLNHDLNQFIDLNEYKKLSVDKHGWCIHPLPLLTAVGNDRGCGDFHEGNSGFEFVGSWDWHLISFAYKPPKNFSKFNVKFIESP